MTGNRTTTSIVRDNTVTSGGTITVTTAGGDVGTPDRWVTEFRAELDKARRLLADLERGAVTDEAVIDEAVIDEAAEAVAELDNALADPKKHRLSIKGLIPVLGKCAETITGLGAIVAAIEQIAHNL